MKYYDTYGNCYTGIIDACISSYILEECEEDIQEIIAEFDEEDEGACIEKIEEYIEDLYSYIPVTVGNEAIDYILEDVINDADFADIAGKVYDCLFDKLEEEE